MFDEKETFVSVKMIYTRKNKTLIDNRKYQDK